MTIRKFMFVTIPVGGLWLAIGLQQRLEGFRTKREDAKSTRNVERLIPEKSAGIFGGEGREKDQRGGGDSSTPP